MTVKLQHSQVKTGNGKQYITAMDYTFIWYFGTTVSGETHNLLRHSSLKSSLEKVHTMESFDSKFNVWQAVNIHTKRSLD